MLTRILRAAAATVVATAALVAVQAAPAVAACPHGERVCVYLPGGSYTLGNPVSTGTGVAPSSRVLLRHCDSTGTSCDELSLNLPGVAFTSTSTAILTLHVPGEGVGISGTTPTLYLGLPSVTPGSPSAGLSLHVEGTTFVLYDTILDGTACQSAEVPANPFVNGRWSPCGVGLTATV